MEAGKITLSEVLSDDKIVDLTKEFSGYTDESLNALKEKVGDKFSWEELRMFKASLKLKDLSK